MASELLKDVAVVVGDTVSPEGGKPPIERAKYAAIIDRKSNRTWTGEGPTESVASTEAFRKFCGDRRAREYVGEG